jgi:hypothetical protein
VRGHGLLSQREPGEAFSGYRVIWDGDMELPATLQDEELGRRMCDAYGMYQYFKSRISSGIEGSVGLRTRRTNNGK